MHRSTIVSISAVDVMCQSLQDSNVLIFDSSICLMVRPKSSRRARVSLYVSQSGIRWRRSWTSSTVLTHLWPKLLPATWEVITKISSGPWNVESATRFFAKFISAASAWGYFVILQAYRLYTTNSFTVSSHHQSLAYSSHLLPRRYRWINNYERSAALALRCESSSQDASER